MNQSPMNTNVLYSLTKISSNRKTGPIPVSSSSNVTCPDSCSFKNGGCYGMGGPALIHWRRISEGVKGVQWEEFCNEIKKIKRGQIWRHNQVGDLVGINEVIDGNSLKMLVAANDGKLGYTYSHKPVISSDTVSEQLASDNRKAVEHANKNGFTINLSCDSLMEADLKHNLNIGPVVVVLNSKTTDKVVYTPEGKKVVICPATYKDDVTCNSCQLCQKQRKCIVGFPAHGNAQNKVNAILAKK
jgi:hypothetical protein